MDLKLSNSEKELFSMVEEGEEGIADDFMTQRSSPKGMAQKIENFSLQVDKLELCIKNSKMRSEMSKVKEVEVEKSSKIQNLENKLTEMTKILKDEKERKAVSSRGKPEKS